jgi:hypothetical protein
VSDPADPYRGLVDALRPLLLGAAAQAEVQERLVGRLWDPRGWPVIWEVVAAARWRALPAALRSVRPGASRWAWADELLAARLGAGMVALVRSQKIIVFDRPRGVVYHLLRPELAAGGDLLGHEVTAGLALPAHTVPVVASRLDEPPFFIVQRYLPYRPEADWRRLRPRLAQLVELLWRYYERCGIEEVSTRAYVEKLVASVQGSLAGLSDPSQRSRASAALARVLETYDRIVRPSEPPTMVTVQSHGDFIAGHVARPLHDRSDRLLIVDWSESHRYSAFFDLFYFQFQNSSTDLWARLMRDPRLDPRDYFGEGYARLAQLLGQRPAAPAPGTLRWQMLLGLVEELEHRLQRLHPRYLGFWIKTAEGI